MTEYSLAQSSEPWRGVPYVTLRDRVEESERGIVYGDERSTLKAGRCALEESDLDFLSSAADVVPFGIPEGFVRVRDVREEPLGSLLDHLKETAPGGPLLYMHGYYIDFDKGCRRATIFKESAGLDGRFLWFSWPSDGTLLNYSKDEVNLYWSIPELVDVITELRDRFGNQNFHLAGHSLGGRGLALALYEISYARPDLRVDNAVFMAPDMDFDIFVKLLPRIRTVAERITLYTSDADKALVVSAQLHGYPRLGQSGINVSLLDGVEVIDTSDLPTRSANGHLYHIYNEEVGRDLDQLINQGLSATERINLVESGENLWRLQPGE